MTSTRDSLTGFNGQEKISPTIARLRARLEAADTANREAFAAWEWARDNFESVRETAYLFEQVEAARAPLRDAERAYRAAVRGRVVKRGHKSNRRIAGNAGFDIEWNSLRVAESDARARLTGDMDECGNATPKAETKRELIDAHATLEGVMIDWDLHRLRNRTLGRDRTLLRAHGILS